MVATSSNRRANFQAGEDSALVVGAVRTVCDHSEPHRQRGPGGICKKIYTGKDGRQIQPNTTVTLSHSFKYCYLWSPYSVPAVNKTEKVPILTERRVP